MEFQVQRDSLRRNYPVPSLNTAPWPGAVFKTYESAEGTSQITMWTIEISSWEEMLTLLSSEWATVDVTGNSFFPGTPEYKIVFRDDDEWVY